MLIGFGNINTIRYRFPSGTLPVWFCIDIEVTPSSSFSLSNQCSTGIQLKIFSSHFNYVSEYISITMLRHWGGRAPSNTSRSGGCCGGNDPSSVSLLRCTRSLRSDNGPEFIARRMKIFLSAQQVQTKYIAPGCPRQNAYGESFHEKLRTECLNREVFRSLEVAQWVVNRWHHPYNQDRPHSSLDSLTPRKFLLQWNQNQPGRNQPLLPLVILSSFG